MHFQHDAPHDFSKLHRVFACPFGFGEPRNELRFDRSVLELRLHTATPDLSQHLAARAQQLAETVPEEDLLAEVRSAIGSALPSGAPTLAKASKQLGTFAALVDDVRQGLAVRVVIDRRVNLEEVGFLLGFADSRGFRRAFDRWTGQSPRSFRLQQAS